MGHEIPLEVHHVDGDRLNNELSNLQLLCPNCHAQTDNYCGKNIRYKEAVPEEKLIEALKVSPNIKQALSKIGINYSAKSWYDKAKRLMEENNIEFTKKEVSVTVKKREYRCRRCSVCGKPLQYNTKGTLCKECYRHSPDRRNVEWPSKETLLNDITTMSFLKVGEKYGVTDNAVRKWCRYYGLPATRKELRK